MLIRNLKQTLNDRLVSKSLHWIVKFKQKGWLKSWIDTNTDISKKSKKWFWKILF